MACEYDNLAENVAVYYWSSETPLDQCTCLLLPISGGDQKESQEMELRIKIKMWMELEGGTQSNVVSALNSEDLGVEIASEPSRPFHLFEEGQRPPKTNTVIAEGEIFHPPSTLSLPSIRRPSPIFITYSYL